MPPLTEKELEYYSNMIGVSLVMIGASNDLLVEMDRVLSPEDCIMISILMITGRVSPTGVSLALGDSELQELLVEAAREHYMRIQSNV